MSSAIEWEVGEVEEAAAELGAEHTRGFTLDNLLDKLTDFSIAPHFEKMWLGNKLRELGYENKLITHDGTKTNRWFRAPKRASSFLSGGMLESLESNNLIGSSPAAPRQLDRKPLRLPAPTWQKIREIKEEAQRLHPDKRVTLSSTVESLIAFAIENATIPAE